MSKLSKRAPTSASNFFRRVLCKGSEAIEKDLPEVETEYSAEGQLLHKHFMTGKRPKTLKPEQVQVLDDAEFYAHEFIGRFSEQLSIPADEPFRDEREIGLVCHDTKGVYLFPGHADFIRTWPRLKYRVIIDGKFGVTDVDYAADNWQLLIYAVMRHQQYRADKNGVCLVQPRNFGPRQSSAIYDYTALDSAVGIIEKTVEEIRQPGAKLTPGEKQCHFCKAKSVCEAYQKAIQITLPEAGIISLPSDQLIRLHTAIKFAANISKEVTGEMRRRIEANQLPGWKLKNMGEERECNDKTGLFLALRDHFKDNPKFSARGFDDCCQIGWGKLEEYVQELTGFSEKKSKEWLKDFAEPFVTTTPKAKAPTREKE